LSDIKDKIKEFIVDLQKGQLIGIDIGLSSVKMCYIEASKKGKYKLERYESMQLSEASIIEDEIQKPEEVIELISKIYANFNLKKVQIACLGIDGPNTVTKRIQVPDGVEEDVEDNILWESEQYIPFGSEDAEIGYSILGRIEEEDVVDAIVGAGKTEVIERYMEYIKEAGLYVKVVELNIFALVNVFEECMKNRIDDMSEEGTIIIDFGAQYTSVIVYKNGGPVLTKEINIGGVLVTEEIQRTMGVSYEEAEDLKVYGDDNGNLPEEILGIVNDHNARLMDELKKVLNFFIAAGSSEQVGNCVITGGSSLLPGLKNALSSLIDLEIEELDPFSFLDLKVKLTDEQMHEIKYCGAVVIGLGMRSV